MWSHESCLPCKTWRNNYQVCQVLSNKGYRIYHKHSDTSTPYHTCSKIWTSTIYYPMLCLKIAGWMVNTLRRLIWVYTFCSGLFVRIHTGNTVTLPGTTFSYLYWWCITTCNWNAIFARTSKQGQAEMGFFAFFFFFFFRSAYLKIRRVTVQFEVWSLDGMKLFLYIVNDKSTSWYLKT